MDKPPDHTAEQADICCELGVVLGYIFGCSSSQFTKNRID